MLFERFPDSSCRAATANDPSPCPPAAARRWWQRLGAACVAGLCVVGLAGGAAASEEAARPPVLDPAQDAWKQAHVARVAAGLAAADDTGLPEASRTMRRTLVDALRAYGQRGVFAQNVYWPGHAISSLIDPFETRCALAHLIDVSGATDLLGRLAATQNHAFVPALLEDEGFVKWLDAVGLRPSEAAWIQGPGFTDPVSMSDSASTATASPGPPPMDAPTSLARPGTGMTRRGGAGESTWSMWWAFERDALISLRERYHALFPTTSEGDSNRGLRVAREEVDRVVVPFFEALATNPDSPVRATALMAWARAVSRQDAPKVVAATSEWLAREKNAPWRDVMVLAYGVTRHASALKPLLSLVRDDSEGRELLGKERVSDRMRALAAIGLGELRMELAAAPLLEIVAQSENADLRCAALIALGRVGSAASASTKTQIRETLLAALARSKNRSEEERASVPAALALLGDPLALPALVDVLATFRDPGAMRPAAVRAVWILAGHLDESLADTLIETSRRDPEDDARRYALLALGTLAAKGTGPWPLGDGAQVPHVAARVRLGDKLARFYEGCFNGLHVAKREQPWVALSSALFLRAFPQHGERLIGSLRSMAQDRGLKERQGAAVVALGLIDDKDGVPALRKQLDGASDVELRSWLCLGLGLLDDRAARAELLATAREDGSDIVRYRAAIGLGYVADHETVPALVAALRESGSQPARTALARVVGELGDRRALRPLMEIVGDKSLDEWTRHRALGAMAMICQEGDTSWVVPFQQAMDPMRTSPSQGLLLSLF